MIYLNKWHLSFWLFVFLYLRLGFFYGQQKCNFGESILPELPERTVCGLGMPLQATNAVCHCAPYWDCPVGAEALERDGNLLWNWIESPFFENRRDGGFAFYLCKFVSVE